MYRVGLTGFLAAGLVFTTSAVNSLIYFPQASKEAAAAGFILLSIDCVSLVLPLYTVNRVANDQHADRLDVLLRRRTTGKSPPDSGLLRSSQGSCTESQQ